MNTASLIFGLVAVIGLVVATVLVALIYRQALRDTQLNAIRSRQLDAETLDKALDRIMTVRWEDYAALRTTVETSEENEGGFFEPEGETGAVYARNELGREMPINLSLAPDEEDLRLLLDEDFDETDTPRRSA